MNDIELPRNIFKPLHKYQDDDDIYHREDNRLKTFERWPLKWLDKRQLAMSGLYYLGVGDKTKCYFCNVEISCWEQKDHPLREHISWSPNCCLLRRCITNNVPINWEDFDKYIQTTPLNNDICGLNYFTSIDSQQNNTSSMMYLTLSPDSPPSDSSSTDISSTDNFRNSIYTEYPEYTLEATRLQTFRDWPKHMKQKPFQLAEAGFFYTLIDDRVKCFSCGGGLKDWDADDDPWQQHALWLSDCNFLKLMKGQIYIDSVINLFMREKQLATNELESIPSPSSKCVELIAPKPSMATTTDDKFCKICYVNEYNTAFLPCGHVVACAQCASSVIKCPLCRQPFIDIMRVYFS